MSTIDSKKPAAPAVPATSTTPGAGTPPTRRPAAGISPPTHGENIFSGPGGPTRGIYTVKPLVPLEDLNKLRVPASVGFEPHPPAPTTKPPTPKLHVALRAGAGFLMALYTVQDILEIRRLNKDPKSTKKDYAPPILGLSLSVGELISLAIGSTAGSTVIATAGTGVSWWTEGNREDIVVDKFLYPALLRKDTATLNELIDLDHWSGHIVDDDVLTKLIEKVKKYNPEILSRNNKEWADFWKSPEMNHFRFAAVDRLNDLLRPSSDRNAATFFLESGIDFDHLKKEDSSALYELETRWSNRVDQPLQNPYNKEQSGVTLRDLKARVYKLYSENQQTIALSKPADLGTSRLAQPPIESAKVVEDPILKATKDIEKVKQLRKEKNLDEAMRLAQNIIHNLTILPSLPQSNTPEASYLRGTALAYIGTIQYEMAMNEHSTNFEVARRTLNDALQQLRAGQFQKQLPTREIGFVHYNLAKIALASKDESLAVTEYTMAAAEYFMAKKDSRYNSVKKETNINLSNAYYEIGRLTINSDKDRAKNNFQKSFDCAAEIPDETLKTRAQTGLNLVQ